jgi:hypothetical protein
VLTFPPQLDKEPVVAATKIVIGDEAFQQAMIKEPPNIFASPLLIAASLVAFCCSTANGYDGSLFGTLLANPIFNNFFGVENAGIQAGM